MRTAKKFDANEKEPPATIQLEQSHVLCSSSVSSTLKCCFACAIAFFLHFAYINMAEKSNNEKEFQIAENREKEKRSQIFVIVVEPIVVVTVLNLAASGRRVMRAQK